MGESQYVMSLAHGACAGRSFDGVIASEVIEHVDGVPAFCAALAGLARPGGGVVISTISRTQRSYAVAILGAEYLLGLVPRGTHQWERFITPGEDALVACCSMQRNAMQCNALQYNAGDHAGRPRSHYVMCGEVCQVLLRHIVWG